MVGDDSWSGHTEWHELLDAICVERGHLDNLALAEQVCGASGNRTRGAFETAVKNLRNWRQGVHLPQRKNFLILERLLKIDETPGLRPVWRALYTKARRGEQGREEQDKSGTQRKRPRTMMAAAGFVAIAMAAGMVLMIGQTLNSPQLAANDDGLGTFEGIVADYVRNVSLKVGESMIIHGARGNECGDAPSWESARQLLPELATGTLSDGGVGTRNSRQCGGRVPARAILFSAHSTGIEQTSLYGDEVVIRITE